MGRERARPEEPPDELAAFCRTHYGSVTGAVRLLVPDESLTQEIVQEAFIRACERWDELEHMQSPGGWIHTVAVNLALSSLRRSSSERRALRRLHGRRQPDGLDPGEPPSITAPEVEALRAAVAELPTPERSVIVVRYYLGCSIAETAAMLGIAEGTVKTRARRAVERLRTKPLLTEVADA